MTIPHHFLSLRTFRGGTRENGSAVQSTTTLCMRRCASSETLVSRPPENVSQLPSHLMAHAKFKPSTHTVHTRTSKVHDHEGNQRDTQRAQPGMQCCQWVHRTMIRAMPPHPTHFGLLHSARRPSVELGLESIWCHAAFARPPRLTKLRDNSETTRSGNSLCSNERRL